MGNNLQPGICDVCLILDDDKSEKQVYYCGMCKAWICEKCQYDGPRRARAFYKRALNLLKTKT